VNNLPNMDIGSLTDADLLLSFRSGNDSRSRLNGIEIKTQPKNNNLNPVFHCYEEFPFLPLETDSLSVKILDYDLTSHDDKVGKVLIPMTELASLKEMTVPLLMQTKRKTDGVPTVTLHHYLPSLVSQ
jgi:Ca2+-dependent lipid-binding protein